MSWPSLPVNVVHLVVFIVVVVAPSFASVLLPHPPPPFCADVEGRFRRIFLLPFLCPEFRYRLCVLIGRWCSRNKNSEKTHVTSGFQPQNSANSGCNCSIKGRKRPKQHNNQPTNTTTDQHNNITSTHKAHTKQQINSTDDPQSPTTLNHRRPSPPATTLATSTLTLTTLTPIRHSREFQPTPIHERHPSTAATPR